MSVVIPLYNKCDTILRAVQSFLAQTEPDIELIIVDDGSTDGSGELVRPLCDARIRVVHQKNQGPGRARNVGAALARAELLAFLDADDEWRPGFASAAIGALQGNPGSVAYVCGYDSGSFRLERPNKVAELGKREGSGRLPTGLNGNTLKRHVDAMHSGCVVVRSSVFTGLGGYYDKDRCVYGEDGYLWLQVLFSGPVFWDPAERLIFHVEDSALGFALKHQSLARPISLELPTLQESCPSEYGPSLRRVAKTFAEHDMGRLRTAGAWDQIRMLRRIHGGNTPRALLADLASYVFSSR